jgi:arsenate reductase
MAEAFLKRLAGDKCDVESAGLEPGTLNPVVVEAMRDAGIDISGHTTRSVFDLLKEGRAYHYVVTVCDESQSERCPVFPGPCRRLHWGFPDPSRFQGSREEKLEQTKQVRDQIRRRIEQWLEEEEL